jgi:hypothetical protein
LQAANRAASGLLIQNLCFWVYADDKEHYSGSLRAVGPMGRRQGFRVQSYNFLCNLYYSPEIPQFANSQ